MQAEKEPPYIHGTRAKTAVVLINLGTPDAPTAAALRRYLKQFLSDPRVVEIPKPLWWLILNGLILPLRSGKSAAKYASIWTEEGSPLRVHTEKQTRLLQNALDSRGHAVKVVHAMRYGSPALPEVLRDLKEQGCDSILILPAYPQYSGTTTASIFDEVFRHYAKVRNIPELRLVKHYHDHDGYIRALELSIRAHWATHGQAEKLVMSFHGVPKRTLLLGDPYHCECHKTARLLAERLQLSPDAYLVTFQSRFGKAEWLQPYTAPTVKKLAEDGVKRIDVVCPGFTSDCLETLEEIAMEVRQDFLLAGGSEFHYIPCLNERPEWISALADVVGQHIAGWPACVPPPLPEQQIAAEASRQRALQLGAAR